MMRTLKRFFRQIGAVLGQAPCYSSDTQRKHQEKEQRAFHVAVLIVHQARKDANSTRPGQALRGSSELHGWGDSNLYMRRRGVQLTLSTEHRAAPSQDHIALELTQAGSALALSVMADSCAQCSYSNRRCRDAQVERHRRNLATPQNSAPRVILPGLPTFPINRIAELTPICWLPRA